MVHKCLHTFEEVCDKKLNLRLSKLERWNAERILRTALHVIIRIVDSVSLSVLNRVLLELFNVSSTLQSTSSKMH